jgi:short-subunit dehydrogenase
MKELPFGKLLNSIHLKNVLITGASGGLGKELTKYFASKGWNVIATMISLDLGKDIRELNNVKCYQLDVSSTESIQNAKVEILKDFETIDVIINNAGIGYRSFVELAEDQKLDNLIDVNWLGVIKVCRAFIPIFKHQSRGQFINITSIAGLVNLPLGNFYHPTKHAIESFSECMAYELKEANIKVCTVQFGNIPTDFQKNITPSEPTKIESYNKLSGKIAIFLAKRTRKNTDLIAKITHKVLNIAENPAKNFKRYTIGFDAKFLKLLHRLLGYQLFSSIVRRKMLN